MRKIIFEFEVCDEYAQQIEKDIKELGHPVELFFGKAILFSQTEMGKLSQGITFAFADALAGCLSLNSVHETAKQREKSKLN